MILIFLILSVCCGGDSINISNNIAVSADTNSSVNQKDNNNSDKTVFSADVVNNAISDKIKIVKGEDNTSIVQALNANNSKVNPTLQPGFMLNIAVTASGIKEFDLVNKRISQEGTILIPLLGHVKAVGMTLPEFSNNLTKLLGEYLRQPKVDVSFVEDNEGISPWGYIIVLGRVNNPGRINMPPDGDLTVSTAIQKSGGLGKSAKETGIIVVRRNPSNSCVERFKVNLRAVAKVGLEADIKLHPGDVVYVPVRIF